MEPRIYQFWTDLCEIFVSIIERRNQQKTFSSWCLGLKDMTSRMPFRVFSFAAIGIAFSTESGRNMKCDWELQSSTRSWINFLLDIKDSFFFEGRNYNGRLQTARTGCDWFLENHRRLREKLLHKVAPHRCWKLQICLPNVISTNRPFEFYSLARLYCPRCICGSGKTWPKTAAAKVCVLGSQNATK